MTMLCSLLTVCFVSAQISRQEGPDGQAAIYRLSLFERAGRCTKFCAMFRQFGKDSLLLATLAYNVGPYRLLGSKTIPKSTLIKKLEAGDRNIYREYVAFCNYKGKRHAMLLKRRKAEFALLYIP